MILYFNIFLCILLLAIVAQDFSYRAIHILILFGLFIVATSIYWQDRRSFLNLEGLLYVSFILTAVWIYISIKQGEIVNPFNQYIGLGDVLFLLAITPLFSLYPLIFFIISGIILAIALSFIFRKTITQDRIPLAGILAAYLLLIKLASFITNHDVFYSSFLTLHPFE